MEITVDRSLRHWWVFVLRGVLFILTGIYMLISPVSSFVAIGFLFGLVILIAGIAELVHAYRDRGKDSRGWHLFVGLFELVLGIVLISHLAASMLVLRLIVGFYFLFRGISIFVFRRIAGSSWWVMLGGLLVLLFAVLVLFNPVFGAVTIMIWIALAFLVTGILNVLVGITMKPAS